MTKSKVKKVTPFRVAAGCFFGLLSLLFISGCATSGKPGLPKQALPLRSVTYIAPGWHQATDGSFIQTQNTGDYARFSFSGRQFGVRIYGPKGITGEIAARVDEGSGWVVLPLEVGVHDYMFFKDLREKEYTVTVVLKNNSSKADNWLIPKNGIRMTHIILDPNGKALPVARKRMDLVVVGDSIARRSNGDATLAWPWHLADLMDAELDLIAFSGQGATGNTPGNVPKAPEALPFQSKGVMRALRPEVDHVFIAHGTNDWKMRTPMRRAHTALWETARQLYPNASICIVLPLGYAMNSNSSTEFRNQRSKWLKDAFIAWNDPNSKIIDLTHRPYGNEHLGGRLSPLHPAPETHLSIAKDIISAMGM